MLTASGRNDVKYDFLFTSGYASKSIQVSTVITGKKHSLSFFFLNFIWRIDLDYTSEQNCCYDLFHQGKLSLWVNWQILQCLHVAGIRMSVISVHKSINLLTVFAGVSTGLKP